MEQNRNPRRKTPSYITITLYARNENQQNAQVETVFAGSSSTNSSNTSTTKRQLRLQWEQTCAKWGFIVERNITYVKPLAKVLCDDMPTSFMLKHDSTIDESADVRIQSQECKKLKDELVISKVINEHDSQKNGSEDLIEGDIIHSIYGMQDPPLSLLFGIMRDSNSFQMTVKRMESDIERRYRLGSLNDIMTASNPNESAKMDVPTNSHPEENHLQSNESLSCPHRSSEEVPDTTERCEAPSQSSFTETDSNSNPNVSIAPISDSDNMKTISTVATNEELVSSPQLVNPYLKRSFTPVYKNPYLKNPSTVTKSPSSQDITPEDVTNQSMGLRNNNENEDTLHNAENICNVEHVLDSKTPAVMHNDGTDEMEENIEHKDRALQAKVLRNKNEDENPLLNEKNDTHRDHVFDRQDSPLQEWESHLDNKETIQEANELDQSSIIEKEMLSDEVLEKEEDLLQKIIGESISKDTTDNNPNNQSSVDMSHNQTQETTKETNRITRKDSVSSLSSEMSKKSKRNKRRKLSASSNDGSNKPPHLPNKRKPSITFDISDQDDEEKDPSREIHRPRVNSESSLSRPSPLTLPRASPLTVSRQSIITTASSKSSKVGLSTAKATKLKRLWPNSIVFVKRILKWTPPSVCEVRGKIRFRGSAKSAITEFPILPTRYKDTSEILRMMTPHILEEGALSVEQEFLSNSDSNGVWTREVFSIKLRSCIPVEPKSTSTTQSVRTYELSFSVEGFISSPPPSNLGEIFVIHCPSWTQETCLGIIGSNDINTTFLTDQKVGHDENDLFKLWICVCNTSVEESPGWLKDENLPSKEADGSVKMEQMYVTNIGTSTDMMRQYEGLKSLACVKPHLKRAAYGLLEDGEVTQSREIVEEVLSSRLSKPRSVVGKVWDHLMENSNKYQLYAIENIMSGKLKDGIFLLQGPPGTGKTQVITQLVSALLNGSSTKASGTRVQVGGAIHGDENPILNVSVAKRILIVAPSNQAVDELAWRIHKHSIGPNGKIGGFNIIRFGMLPGEERHDGRGRKANQRTSSFHSNERDKFLSEINLDNLVRDIACGREVNDFAYRKDAIPEDNSNANQQSQRKSRFINYSIERQKILDQCHVICSTISGAGSKAFIEAVSRDAHANSEFDAVIIDEACQASDYSTLIPFKYNPNILILVGDPNQLPIMTLSKAKNCNSDRSLFERLQQCGWPLHMLRIQYRMHPEIVKFPSRTFYSSNLITSEHILKGQPSPWHSCHAFPPYLMWNFYGSAMHRSPLGGISNRGEASFVVELLQSFANQNAHIRNLDIGIISFYNEQVVEIKNRVKYSHLDRWMYSNKISLQISTVDGFQGSEKDIIILSCVRSRWINDKKPRDVGFLKDFRRVNVALTRAKHSLWIVADCKTLSKDPLWNSLIDDAYDRGLIAQYQTLARIVMNPRGSVTRQTDNSRNRETPKTAKI